MVLDLGVGVVPPALGTTKILVVVAVKELNSTYYIGEFLLLTLYTHYGNLI